MSVHDLPESPVRKTLAKRLIASLVMIPPVIAAVWFGGWAFAALLIMAGVVMVMEAARMIAPPEEATGLAVVCGAGIVAALAAAAAGLEWHWVIAIAVAAWLASTGYARWRSVPVGWSALIMPYVALPGFAFWVLRQDPQFGLEATIWVLVVVWATDTSAYFAGKGIGGPKLAPRASPNKTWAGLCGGMLAAAIAGAAAASVIGGTSAVTLGLLGAMFAVIAQLGDIAESAVKRYFGRKDSGGVIPGHGGVLDRVDGLVSTVIVAVAIGGARADVSNAAHGLLIW